MSTVQQPNVEEPDDDPDTENPLAGLLVTEGRLDLFAALSDLRIVTPSPLPQGEILGAYSLTMQAVGGVPPYTWAFSSAPADFWLSIDPNTGELSGTPNEEQAGTYEFTVSVTDSSLPDPITVERGYQLTIVAGYNLFVRSTPFSNVEIKGDGYGVTDYTRTYPRPDPDVVSASLLAPEKWTDHYYFARWEEDGGLFSYSRAISVSMTSSRTLTAVYEPLKNFYVNDETPEAGIGAGDDANPGTSPAAPKRHIQAMLDAVAAGGYAEHEWRVIVSAGTYEENIVLGPEHSGLTLQGLGWESAVIDGGGVGPCIYADRWERGTIMGFEITNGYCEDGGGGILMSNGCSATIIRNWIVGNTAGEGAAIACYSGTATIKDNYIEDNTAESEGGGILLVESNTVMIEGNAISGCSGDLGGGIRCWVATGWITNNVIVDNTAVQGGGILATGSGMQMDQNWIIGNSASRGGGVFCWASYQPILSNIIMDNVAATAGGGISCEYFSVHPIIDNFVGWNSSLYGGGIYLDSEPLGFTYNEIVYNTAGESGGGLFLGSNRSMVIGTGQLTGQNEISYNDAGQDGGGIFVSSGGSPQIGLPTPDPYPYSNYISENTAGRFGGGIFCGPGSSPVIYNNFISDGEAFHGGGIYCDTTTAMIGNGAVDGHNYIGGNTAVGNGGGIYLTGETMPTLNYNSCSGNTAVEGGGIYLTPGTTVEIIGGPDVFHPFSINSNEAVYGGGIRCPGASLRMTDCVDLIGNRATRIGGGVCVTDSSSVDLAGGLMAFAFNEAYDPLDGALYGGAMYVEDSTLTATSCYVGYNSAPEGPGMYFVDSTADIQISTIEYHSCEAAGAGVRALNSTVTMDESLILGNSVPGGGGGGIYVAEGSTLTMNGTTIQGNSAVEGGGIYVADAAVSVLSDGPFNNVMDNFAVRGAGVYCSADGVLAVGMTRFGESHADKGAGLYCDVGVAPSIENCYFVGNSALQGAGAYCAAGAALEMKNITAVANVSTDGAAVHSESAGVSVKNAIFWLNNEELFGATASYSCIPDPPPGTGNFGDDPLLVGSVYSGTWPESPSSEYVGAFWIPIGVTVFTNVPGVTRDEFAGMWLSPSIETNTQFLIVEDPITASGPTICVRGDARGLAREGAEFRIWDYHPQSTGGHWTQNGWVLDPVTSPCVDAGDPADDYANEPEDNGDRINVGACGNTYQASKAAEHVAYPVAESGAVWVDHNWTTVDLTEPCEECGPRFVRGQVPGMELPGRLASARAGPLARRRAGRLRPARRPQACCGQPDHE